MWCLFFYFLAIDVLNPLLEQSLFDLLIFELSDDLGNFFEVLLEESFKLLNQTLKMLSRPFVDVWLHRSLERSLKLYLSEIDARHFTLWWLCSLREQSLFSEWQNL